MSDLAIPPRSLLDSAFRPLIVAFIQRVLRMIQFGLAGVTLTSWYRTADSNRAEGGSPESQHLFGLAMDLSVEQTGLGLRAGREPQALRAAANRAGLIAVPNPARGILHVQLLPAGALARAGVRFPE